MEPVTVVGCVLALTEVFAEGHGHYDQWKRKRSHLNHYRRAGTGGQKGVVTCALSSSLEAAEIQIKETYDVAFSRIGSEFSVGDAKCRDMLCNQLFNLRIRVSHLRKAVEPTNMTGILNISDILQISEGARIASVRALADLYQRMAATRTIPADLPVPKPRLRQGPRSRFPESLPSDAGDYRHDGVDHDEENDDEDDEDTEEDEEEDDDDDDDDSRTVLTNSTERLRFQSEPPSPPLTPPKFKPFGSDAGSVFAPSEAGGSVFLRPKVSVFSMFCPEAMVLQVDLSKSTPQSEQCKCGYHWKPPLPDNKDFFLLKEGFRMTGRFLAKSHSDKDDFGCILCVSSGRRQTYDSPEALASHINSSHTKWQILHERDIA